MKKNVLILSLSAMIIGLAVHTTKSMISSNIGKSTGSTSPVTASDIENQLSDLEKKTDQLQVDLNAGATAFATNITLKIKELIENAEDVASKSKNLVKKINVSTDPLEAKKLGINVLLNLTIYEINLAASLAEIVDLTQFLARGDLHTNKSAGEDITKKTELGIEMLTKLEKISNKLKTSLNTLSASSIFSTETSPEFTKRASIGLTSPKQKSSTLLSNLGSGVKSGLSTVGTGLKEGWSAIGGTELLKSGVVAGIQGGFNVITAWINNKAAEREFQAKQLANAQQKAEYEEQQRIINELISRVNAEQSRYNTIAGLINRPITALNDQLSRPMRKLKNDTQEVIDSITKINNAANNDATTELNKVNASLKFLVTMGENNVFLMDVALEIINAINKFNETIFSENDEARLQLTSATKNAKNIFDELKEFFDEMPALQVKLEKMVTKSTTSTKTETTKTGDLFGGSTKTEKPKTTTVAPTTWAW